MQELFAMFLDEMDMEQYLQIFLQIFRRGASTDSEAA
jgi:hypothetical protein